MTTTTRLARARGGLVACRRARPAVSRRGGRLPPRCPEDDQRRVDHQALHRRRDWLVTTVCNAEAGVSSSSGGDFQDFIPQASPQEEHEDENEVVPSSGDSQAEYEDELPDVNKVFPRLREKDPHKLLGIGSEASYEEVQEARAFLVEEYKGNKASVEAIEIAHDKIITGSFKHRRQEGIQLVSKGKGGKQVLPPSSAEEDEPEGPLGRFLDTRVARKTLLKIAGVFLSVIVWTVATALDSEPTAQVTVGLMATTFFVQQKRQKKADKEENVFWGSVGTAIVATAAGWILGNIFPVVLPVLPENVSVQAVCTLFALVAQWFASAYVK